MIVVVDVFSFTTCVDVAVSRGVTWSSADPHIAKVSPNGLVTGVGSGGPITITATSGGLRATTSIRVYPRIVIGITALFALILVVADWSSPAKFPSAGPLNYGLVAAMFALFGLYVGAMPYFGFRISTLLYIAATSWLLEPPRNQKGWLRVGLVALISTVVIYAAFERYLLVLLPRGRWTDF